MATLKQVRAEANRHGATLEVEVGRPEKVCRVRAPLGQHWACREVHEIVIVGGPGDSLGELYADCLEDMAQGLEPCDPASRGCRDWAGLPDPDLAGPGVYTVFGPDDPDFFEPTTVDDPRRAACLGAVLRVAEEDLDMLHDLFAEYGLI